jgi:hypothetical protein
MKCFNHHAQDAVAICQHCGKALCNECLVETEEGIACHGRCERRVGEFNELLNRAENDARSYRSLGIVLVAGAIMLAIFTMALPGIAQEVFGKAQPQIGWLSFAGYGLTALTFASGLICYRQGSPR